jgi:hypothetical protein
MAKIHTHYDNLKVARQAPQEVIRAAYKALSQKYHPDKNPGDEKAARIMAIVNTAYNTLSDPVRRKEHDEWIAAEEWEVEWLESTHTEDGRERARASEQWEAPPAPPGRPRWRALRDPRWWLGMALCFVAGAGTAVLVAQPPHLLPQALAWGGKEAAPAYRADAAPDPARDGWAIPVATDPHDPAPDIKALAVTQLVVPARAPDCDTDLQSLVAPNGDPWPVQSGYLNGYPVGNMGEEMQVVVDNSSNPSPVFVKIYDLDRRANVRHAFVQARARMVIDKLAAGKYEVRYQNILIGAAQGECVNGRRTALRQADAS